MACLMGNQEGSLRENPRGSREGSRQGYLGEGITGVEFGHQAAQIHHLDTSGKRDCRLAYSRFHYQPLAVVKNGMQRPGTAARRTVMTYLSVTSTSVAVGHVKVPHFGSGMLVACWCSSSPRMTR